MSKLWKTKFSLLCGNISGDVVGEIWHWSLLGVKGLMCGALWIICFCLLWLQKKTQAVEEDGGPTDEHQETVEVRFLFISLCVCLILNKQVFLFVCACSEKKYSHIIFKEWKRFRNVVWTSSYRLKRVKTRSPTMNQLPQTHHLWQKKVSYVCKL